MTILPKGHRSIQFVSIRNVKKRKILKKGNDFYLKSKIFVGTDPGGERATIRFGTGTGIKSVAYRDESSLKGGGMKKIFGPPNFLMRKTRF